MEQIIKFMDRIQRTCLDIHLLEFYILLQMQNIRFSKEELLAVNAKLNKIKKPRK